MRWLKVRMTRDGLGSWRTLRPFVRVQPPRQTDQTSPLDSPSVAANERGAPLHLYCVLNADRCWFSSALDRFNETRCEPCAITFPIAPVKDPRAHSPPTASGPQRMLNYSGFNVAFTSFQCAISMMFGSSLNLSLFSTPAILSIH
jgi:hypothetical protein